MTKLVVMFSAVIILFGCADDQGIVQFSKVKTQQPFLAAKSDVTRSLTIERTIEGELGGEINFDLRDSEFGVKGNLEFPEFSFVDQEQVAITIPNTEDGAVILDLTPSEVKLERPIYLSVRFTGLKIEEGDVINFNFIDEKGELNDVEYGRLIIDYGEGWALVVNAKVYKFARYGFTRKTTKL
ncbi:MAG: hypothetical protein GXO85_04675 [Chlorobi bacterium]|nr:hypothetical protein [Chlorobiota bacterium]